MRRRVACAAGTGVRGRGHGQNAIRCSRKSWTVSREEFADGCWDPAAGSGDRVRGRISLVGGLFGIVLLTFNVPVGSQVHQSTEERFFLIEWQLERSAGRDIAIVGFLRNHYLYRLQSVQLQASVLDDSGRVTHQALTTMNDVPPGVRGQFRIRLPNTGARYAVTVHAFEFGPRESP
jgi:hypothetical protein